MSGECGAGVRKQFHINIKSGLLGFLFGCFLFFCIHLVTLILLAQLSSIFINSFVPPNNSAMTYSDS